MLPLLMLLAAPLEIHSSIDGAPPRGAWVDARAGQKVVMHAPSAGTYAWFELLPLDTSVDNTVPSFHFAPIRYEAKELERCRGRQTCEAVGPGLPGLEGVGTT